MEFLASQTKPYLLATSYLFSPLCGGGDGMTKRSFILSSCHQVLSLGGVRADDNAADEERSSEINGEGCAHLSIHSSFFRKTSIHVMLDVRMAKEKKIHSSRSGFYRKIHLSSSRYALTQISWAQTSKRWKIWFLKYFSPFLKIIYIKRLVQYTCTRKGPSGLC